MLSAIERLLEGRTSMTVAHRMSTIRQADRIIVMGSGMVVDDGTHGELLIAAICTRRTAGSSRWPRCTVAGVCPDTGRPRT